ncbi:hypothetical protein [Enterococcus sp. DIV1420a]|uniref:hypothetical protein n=1 Tax=Enterococcus sp. DIV1420a TaxID=2774672 RepID=UPI003F262A9B
MIIHFQSVKEQKINEQVNSLSQIMKNLPEEKRNDIVNFLELLVKYPEWFKAVKVK